MKICFAPDYTDSNPYQSMLAKGLCDLGHEVTFYRSRHRGLPLWRGFRKSSAKIFHLHWPEAYLSEFSSLRASRLDAIKFSVDLSLSKFRGPVVLTAHNFKPHDSLNIFDPWNVCYRHANAIHFHTNFSKQLICNAYNLKPENCVVAPHGDLAPNRFALPRRLQTEDNFFVMFGAIAPYKGIEQIIDIWREFSISAKLIIIGPCWHPDFLGELTKLSHGLERVVIRSKFLPEEQLHDLISGANGAIFNYRSILTSGSVQLAISLGCPALILPSFPTGQFDDDDYGHHVFHGAVDDFVNALKSNFGGGLFNEKHYFEWKHSHSWANVSRLLDTLYKELC